MKKTPQRNLWAESKRDYSQSFSRDKGRFRYGQLINAQLRHVSIKNCGCANGGARIMGCRARCCSRMFIWDAMRARCILCDFPLVSIFLKGESSCLANLHGSHELKILQADRGSLLQAERFTWKKMIMQSLRAELAKWVVYVCVSTSVGKISVRFKLFVGCESLLHRDSLLLLNKLSDFAAVN